MSWKDMFNKDPRESLAAGVIVLCAAISAAIVIAKFCFTMSGPTTDDRIWSTIIQEDVPAIRRDVAELRSEVQALRKTLLKKVRDDLQ